MRDTVYFTLPFIQYVKEHLILTFYTTSGKEGNGVTTDLLNAHYNYI